MPEKPPPCPILSSIISIENPWFQDFNKNKEDTTKTIMLTLSEINKEEFSTSRKAQLPQDPPQLPTLPKHHNKLNQQKSDILSTLN